MNEHIVGFEQRSKNSNGFKKLYSDCCICGLPIGTKFGRSVVCRLKNDVDVIMHAQCCETVIETFKQLPIKDFDEMCNLIQSGKLYYTPSDDPIGLGTLTLKENKL